MTRIALLSDVHGNLVALDAVLADLDRHGVDEVVCLGDVATLGPAPCAVIERLAARCRHLILGNHDEFLLEPAAIERYTDVAVIVESVAWCAGELDAAHRAFLASAVPFLGLDVDGVDVAFFHGSPWSNTTDLLATTPADELDDLLGARTATVMVGGHTHLQLLRQHRGALLVNPGSVGMPFERYVGGAAPTILPHAEYAVVDIDHGRVEVNLRRVGLDRTVLEAAATAAVDLPLRHALAAAYR